MRSTWEVQSVKVERLCECGHWEEEHHKHRNPLGQPNIVCLTFDGTPVHTCNVFVDDGEELTRQVSEMLFQRD